MKAAGTKVRVFCSVIMLLLLILPAGSDAATMNDYCVVPPFIVGGVTPNLLLMIDNSASQYDLGYVAGSVAPAPTFSCPGTGTVAESFCYDNTYDNTYTYVGYYDSAKNYFYAEFPSDNGSSVGPNDYFTETALAIPANCARATSYLCINPGGAAGPFNTITGFYATGNFLNWLASSKFDIQKKILTGGKFVHKNCALNRARVCTTDADCPAAEGVCVVADVDTFFGESRGCNGRRYVKAIPGVADLTFSVRGPNALEPDFVSASTQGGLTRIEIYGSTNPNMEDCQCAVAEWTGGNFGQAQTDSSACMNLAASGAQGNELNAFTHSLQSCWLIKDNFARGLPAFGPSGSTPNSQDLLNDCEQAYSYICGRAYLHPLTAVVTCDNNTNADTADDFPATELPSKITNDTSGSWLCTGVLNGIFPNVHILPPAPYYLPGPAPQGLGQNTKGFIGQCLSAADFQIQGQSLNVVWPNNDCAKNEILHYCFGSQVSEVQDPSSSDISSGNVPAVIMDASIRSLGPPAGTLFSRVASATAPAGLISEFAGLIRFGVMTFNNNGSGSECNPGGILGSNITCEAYCSVTTNTPCSLNSNCPDGETCVQIPKTNGSKIVSYIGYDSIGDHNSGLIKSIDDIRAAAWTPFAEGFYNAIGYFARTNPYTVTPGTSRTDLRIQATDFAGDRNPSQFKCQRNNILLITDGMSTADQESGTTALAQTYQSVTGGIIGYDAANACPSFAGSRNIDDLAWIAKNRNIKTFSKATTSTDLPVTASEYIDTYVVYSGATTGDLAGRQQCSPYVLMSATAASGGTTAPYVASDPAQLEEALKEAFRAISAKTASGTAASVLASGEGSGANLVQAIFYPKRADVNGVTADWTGILQNLWYYNDPFQQSSTIREDSDGDRILKLTQDNVISYSFNAVTNETLVNLFRDTDGDGDPDVAATPPTVPFDSMDHLWEAGKSLFSMTPGVLNTSGGRTIYTNINGDAALDAFDTTNLADLQPLLNANENVPDDAVHTQASRLISYIRGYDTALTIDGVATRNRTLTLGGVTNTWKLADVVNSTPRVMTRFNKNSYDAKYGDTTYSDFIQTPAYKSRAVVFAGGNDGMLHAFDMGLLGIYNVLDKKASIGKYCSTTTHLACSTNADCPSGESCLTDTNMGKEMWSFIPKNTLPYLKYFAASDYCHVYSVDATPYFADVSIAAPGCTEADTSLCPRTIDSWRTILIGSMRLGGACRNSSSTCGDCAKTPVNNLGFSTYFALDVTNPANPSLMWEFSNQDLGMSTAGPAVVRVAEKNCSLSTGTSCTVDSDCPALETCRMDSMNKNGKWFVVLGSGPTGYVSPSTHQFTGIGPQYDANDTNLHSNSPKLFVLDLKTGSLQATLRPDASFYSGYYGSLVNSAVDFDLDYSDDALYFGYTRTNRAAGFDSVGVSTLEPPPLPTTTLAVPNELNFRDDSFLSGVDDAYKGKFIEIVDSTGRWMTRLIYSYNGTTKVMKLDSSLPTDQISDTWHVFPGWNQGGVMRLVTKNNISPALWAISPVIADGDSPFSNEIGPVNASVTKLVNESKHTVRLYFGSGRYFYKINDMIDDDAASRRLFGVKEPCYTASGFDPYCTSTVPFSDLVNSESYNECLGASSPVDPAGWYINLDSCTDSSGGAIACTNPAVVYRTERMVTNPLAINTGVVFYTTTKPSADICSYGGLTHLYAVRYDTGGCVPDGILKGKAIMQLSTGAIKEIDLKDAFTEKGNIRAPHFQGQPPEGQGLSVSVPPQPMDTILHIRKK